MIDYNIQIHKTSNWLHVIKQQKSAALKMYNKRVGDHAFCSSVHAADLTVFFICKLSEVQREYNNDMQLLVMVCSTFSSIHISRDFQNT